MTRSTLVALIVSRAAFISYASWVCVRLSWLSVSELFVEDIFLKYLFRVG
jgi:hypothetical protein